MTWITDENGRRWVPHVPRKARKPAQPRRFANLKVGDQIMQKGTGFINGRPYKVYYVVTDIWFDPVRGQRDPVAGTMVGYCVLKEDGTPWQRKLSMPIRGLASQRFFPADIDYIDMAAKRAEAMADGKVVGIGKGHVIRRRPKIPGGGI